MAPEKPNKQPEVLSPENRAERKAESPEQKSGERVQRAEKDLKEAEEKVRVTEERKKVYDSDPSSKEFDEWASSKEGQTYHVYSIVSEDTWNILDNKIKLLERNLESDRQEKARAIEARLAKRNWLQRMMRVGEERIDIDPMTGEPRLTDMQKIEKAQREAQEEALKNLQFKRLDLRKGFDGKDYGEKLENLKKFRISIGLPALPHGLVDYDTFQKMAIQGIEKQDPSTKVNWDAVKGRIDSFVSLLDKLEITLQAVDTGVGIAASFVPYGDEVYEMTKQLTYVSTGEKTAEQAAKDFAFNIIASKVAGKAVDKLQIGKLAEKYAKAFAKKFSKEFAKKAIPFLAKVGASAAEGAGRGAVSGGVESSLHGIDKRKSPEQMLNDAISAAERGAVIGGILGPVGVYLRYKLASRNKTSAGNEQPAQPSKEDILNIPDTPDGRAVRVALAQEILDLPSINERQAQAVLDAHDVKMSGDKYSVIELAQKVRILEAGGFTRDQADALLRMGICGSKPTSGPPPPPPPRRKPSAETAQTAPAATPAGTPAINVVPKGPSPPPPPPRRSAATPPTAPASAPRSVPELKVGSINITPEYNEVRLPITESDLQGWTRKANALFVKIETKTLFGKTRTMLTIPSTGRDIEVQNRKPVMFTSPDGKVIVLQIGSEFILYNNGLRFEATPNVAPTPQPAATPAPRPQPSAAPVSTRTPKSQTEEVPTKSTPENKPKPPDATQPQPRALNVRPPVGKAPEVKDTPVGRNVSRFTPHEQSVLNEYNALTNSPEKLQQWTAKYGNMSPERAAMTPELQQTIRRLRDRGVFTFKSYVKNFSDKGKQNIDGAYGWAEHPNINRSIPQTRIYRAKSSDALDPSTTSEIAGSSPNHRENLILRPALALKKGEKFASPIAYDEIIPGSGDKQNAWTLTYTFLDALNYRGGEYVDTPKIRKGNEKIAINPETKPGQDSNTNYLQAADHDSKMQASLDAQPKQPLSGSRENELTITVTLPESEARALAEYFKSNPDMIRPFFLTGMQGIEYTHIPPPYQATDSKPNPGILFREMKTRDGIRNGDKLEYADQVLR